MMYKCFYCRTLENTFTKTVEHLQSKHADQPIKLKVKTFSPKSGKLVFKTRHYNVVPKDRILHVVEPESIIAYQKEPSDSPQPKRRLMSTDMEEYDTSETESAASVDLSFISDEEEQHAIEELNRLMPQVVENLRSAKQLDEFTSSIRLTAQNKFPTRNIAYLLFLDVCKFLSKENTLSMRYNKDVKEFWRIGYQLFHGKFLRFAMGFKNIGQIIDGTTSKGLYDPAAANINFVVPSTHILNNTTSATLPSPGILTEMVDTIALFEGQLNEKCYKICVDGKKIIHAPKDEGSEIDLFGYEFPSKLERKDRLEKEKVSINSALSMIQRLADFGKESTKDLSICQKLDICKDMIEIIKLLSIRLRNLRETHIKKQFIRQKFRDMAGPNWQKSKFAMVISAISVHLLRISETIQSLLDLSDKLCEFVSVMNESDFCSGRNQIQLGCHQSYVCLQDVSDTIDNPELTKQRTPAWHLLRKQAKITGSTMYSALGLESLKKQKEHYDNVVNGKDQERRYSDEEQRRMQHGLMHEIDGVATIVSKVIPVWFPTLQFVEEGCYKLLHEGEHLATISPDGSLRSKETMTAELAVEIKCPFQSTCKLPVQYDIPPRYTLQLLAKMHAMNVKQLLYISYSSESTAVHLVSFDSVLWGRVWNESLRVYSSSTRCKPTKTSSAVPDLRTRIAMFCKTNVQFLGEVVSSVAVTCQNKDHTSVVDGRGFHKAASDPGQKEVSVRQMESVIFRCGNVIHDCNGLTKTVASEVLVFILTDLDLDRLYKEEIPHAMPIAYGLKGYSLSTDALRKTIQHVMLACHQKGLYVPVASFDGQWYRLAVRDGKDRPLTKLQLQKDVWRMGLQKSKADILKYILTFGASDAEALSKNQPQQMYEVHITDGKLNVQRNPRCLLKPFFTSVAVIKALSCKLDTETRNERLTSDIDDVCSILVHENKEIPEVEVLSSVELGSSNANQSGQCDTELALLSDFDFKINDSNVVEESIATVPGSQMSNGKQDMKIDTSSFTVVLGALQGQSDEKKRKKWISKSVEEYRNLYGSYKTFSTSHTKQELLSVHITLERQGHSLPVIYGSWRKKKIAEELFTYVTGRSENLTEKPCRRVRHIQSLKKLAMGAVRKLPKQALTVAFAEHIWVQELTKWQSGNPICNGKCLSGLDDIIDWYSMPEYDELRGAYQFNILDPYHLVTNARVTVCTRGLPRAGVKKASFLRVAESCKDSRIGLSLPMVEELIDKQSIAFALTTFSEGVAEALRQLGDHGSAEFCDLIRNWYQAEDDPGMSALERIRHRLDLREWLLRGVQFDAFPPPGNTVKDIPVTMFEGLLTNVERRIQLYLFIPSGSYNARALGSLDAETFFSGFQDLDPKGTGILRPNAIPKAMKVATDIVSAKLQRDRSFVLRTSKKTVYPVKEIQTVNTDDSVAETPWVSPQMVSEITPRDHPFDLLERRRTKKCRKSGTVSEPEHPGRGAMPVRQFHKRDETKILSHKRAGISLDFV